MNIFCFKFLLEILEMPKEYITHATNERFIQFSTIINILNLNSIIVL